MTAAQTPPPAKITLSAKPNGRRPWLIGLALAVLALLIFFVVVAGSAITAKEGSTYSQAPGGYRDWYTYMEKEYNLPVRRWQKSYKELEGKGQTLIQIQPGGLFAFLGMGTDLRSWVTEGNTLIELGWLDRVTPAPFRSQFKTSVGPVVIETSRRLPRPGSRYTPLLKDKYGAVVWMESAGAGKIVHITYPYLAANIHKADKGNFAYLAKLARDLKERGMEVGNWGDGEPPSLSELNISELNTSELNRTPTTSKILVDEWIHGYRDRPKPADAPDTATEPQDIYTYLFLRTPALAILVQLILLLLWLIWGYNRRFGPIQTPIPPEAATSERYVQALSEVLNAAGHRDFIFAQLGQRFRQQLANNVGLAADITSSATLPADTVIAEAWAQQTGKPAQEVLKLLQQASGGRKPSEPELFAWVKAVRAVLQQ